MKPRALDLFCCAGGAGMGLAQAGFDVVGVDIEPQRHYPFEFHQADALDYPLEGFDFVWASPPCQAYTLCQRIRDNEHPDLIEPIRARIRAGGVPWCIENVPGAPLLDPIEAMGIDWMPRDKLREAIPPAYSEFIGRAALSAIRLAA